MSAEQRTDLRKIVQGGATPRILDLWSIGRRHGHRFAHAEKPFFLNPALNASFLIKHTVRPYERSYILSSMPVVTKIIIPVQRENLAAGGHSFFLDEGGFSTRFHDFLGRSLKEDEYALDLKRLHELKEMPSYDPFLLADRFRNHERPVAEHYFGLTPDDQKKMETYVAEEIAKVVGLAFGQAELAEDDERALRFAREILSGEESERLQLLQAPLGMTPEEFKRGLFGWKGILYYRYKIQEAKDALRKFVHSINDIIILGASQTEYDEIQDARRAVLSETRQRWAALSSVMDDYELEFGRFCSGKDAAAARRFLIKAPDLFFHLGSDLSAVSHVTSYWDYWGREREPGKISAREAMEVFPGFVTSLKRDEGLGVPRALID